MKENIISLKKWIILIIIGVLSYWTVFNFGLIWNIIVKFLEVMYPFLLGGAIAFILNIPMSKIEKFLNKKTNSKKTEGANRAISIILSLLLFIAIIAFVAFLLIPELIENIKLLINNIPTLIENIEVFILNLLDKYPDLQLKITEMFNETTNYNTIITDILNYIVNGAIGFVSNLISGIVTLLTAIIFAIYILTQKEYLMKGTKKLINAYFSKSKVNKIEEIASLSNKTFQKFISGQCVEAVILGAIFFVVLSIFRFPYALLISVLTTITALIPIFGALIAMIIGAVLIAITNPIKAIVFMIMFLIIQQIEGNVIYPKVVGKSVGLSPMWTLLAISVGGSLFGIIGMLIGLPLASIIYTLLKNDVNKKISKKYPKKIESDK